MNKRIINNLSITRVLYVIANNYGKCQRAYEITISEEVMRDLLQRIDELTLIYSQILDITVGEAIKELEFFSKRKKTKCSICKENFLECGNNAEPINNGVCCNFCDNNVVTPKRIEQMRSKNK